MPAGLPCEGFETWHGFITSIQMSLWQVNGLELQSSAMLIFLLLSEDR